MADRFDLEQKILGCWHITDDLKLFYHKFDELTEDEKANFLLGIIQLYQMKFDDTFKCFEELIRERKL